MNGGNYLKWKFFRADVRWLPSACYDQLARLSFNAKLLDESRQLLQVRPRGTPRDHGALMKLAAVKVDYNIYIYLYIYRENHE